MKTTPPAFDDFESQIIVLLSDRDLWHELLKTPADAAPSPQARALASELTARTLRQLARTPITSSGA